MDKLKGKRILITGASSGIGEQLAYSVSKEGAQALLVARRQDKLQEIGQVCYKLSGCRPLILSNDLNKPENIEYVIHEAFKDGFVDVLFQNAGYGQYKNALAFEYTEIESMFRLNTLSAVYLVQLCAQRMAEAKNGHIFITASMAGKISTPQSAVYSATKSALLSYADTLRLELKSQNVQVTTINTGPVRTNFHEIAGSGSDYLEKVKLFLTTPEELAEKAVKSIGKRKREINKPAVMEVGYRLYKLFPKIGDILVDSLFDFK